MKPIRITQIGPSLGPGPAYSITVGDTEIAGVVTDVDVETSAFTRAPRVTLHTRGLPDVLMDEADVMVFLDATPETVGRLLQTDRARRAVARSLKCPDDVARVVLRNIAIALTDPGYLR